MAFFLLTEEITQVKEAIPWVRCRAVEVPKKKVVKKAPLTGASGAF